MAKRINSRAKGAAAEREAAGAIAKVFGVQARRGQQFSGSPDSPDIVSDLDVHWECKRVEKGNPYQWLEQAIRDAGERVPVVIHRRNNHEWILVMRLTDAPRFSEAVQAHAEMAAQDVPPEIPSPDCPGSGSCAARQTGRVVHPERRRGCHKTTKGAE
jgi:hypothetical protein